MVHKSKCYLNKKEGILKKLNMFEKIWLISFLVIVVSVTIFFSVSGTNYSSLDSIALNWIISPLSAITGIVCVVLAAKGNKWNYAWGLVNCVTYGYLSYRSGYYGDMILNLFYFLPFQFIGYFWWQKHLKNNSNEDVKMRRLGLKQMVWITFGGLIATIVVGLALFQVDNWFVNVMKRNISIYSYINNVFHVPFLGSICDASTEILQILGQILMTWAFAEQWIMWILTNVITIAMWYAVIVADIKTIAWALPTLIMWIAYLVNSVYGYVNWLRGSKNEEVYDVSLGLVTG
jgi:nicotinamide mononucleotide transporter